MQWWSGRLNDDCVEGRRCRVVTELDYPIRSGVPRIAAVWRMQVNWRSGVVCAIVVLVLSGCVGRLAGTWLPTRGVPQGSDPAAGAMCEPVVAPPPGLDGCARTNERLTLSRALWLAHIYNPELAEYSYEIRARDAEMLQAGLKPNPEIGVEVENFGGTGDASGCESAETTIMLSQVIPMGGKIGKRVALKGLDRDMSRWDYEAKRVATMKEVAKRFVGVLVAQEKLKVARDKISLADEVMQVADIRYRAGSASLVDKTRTEAVQAINRIALRKAKHELAAARHELAAMWGSTEPKFSNVVGNLYATTRVPERRLLASWISRNPEVARWATEMSRRWAELRLAKAERMPDVTAGFGVRRINQLPEEAAEAGPVPVPNDTAFVAEVSVPVQVFDRNQGTIRAAQSRIAKGEQQRREAWVRVQTALATSYHQLMAAYVEATSIESEVIPALQSVFDRTRIGYREGQMGYLDLLAAQKSLVEKRERYIEALGMYHNALAELESLIGQPLVAIR